LDEPDALARDFVHDALAYVGDDLLDRSPVRSAA
jgi:hypothetical protein